MLLGITTWCSASVTPGPWCRRCHDEAPPEGLRWPREHSPGGQGWPHLLPGGPPGTLLPHLVHVLHQLHLLYVLHPLLHVLHLNPQVTVLQSVLAGDLVGLTNVLGEVGEVGEDGGEAGQFPLPPDHWLNQPTGKEGRYRGLLHIAIEGGRQDVGRSYRFCQSPPPSVHTIFMPFLLQ